MLAALCWFINISWLERPARMAYGPVLEEMKVSLYVWRVPVMNHLIRIYIVLPLVFKFLIRCRLDQTFFEIFVQTLILLSVYLALKGLVKLSGLFYLRFGQCQGMYI